MDKVMEKELAGSRSPGSKEQRILMKPQLPPPPPLADKMKNRNCFEISFRSHVISSPDAECHLLQNNYI